LPFEKRNKKIPITLSTQQPNLTRSFIILCLFCLCQLCPVMAQEDVLLSREEMEADLDHLTRQLLEIHPGLHYYDSSQQLPALIASVRASLPEQLNRIDFLLHLAPILQATKCGHTGFNIDTKKKKTRLFKKDIESLFPLQLKLVDGLFFVHRNLSTDTTLIKDKMQLLSIDGQPMEDILLRLASINLGSDGDNRLGEIHFVTKYFLLAYKMFYGAKDSFDLELNDLHNNSITKVRVASSTLKTMRQTSLKRYPEQVQAPIRLHKIEGVSDVAVLDVNTFTNNRMDPFQLGYALKIKKIFKLIEKEDYEYLIVDLRNNPGGVVENVVRLMKYTYNKPFTMTREVSLNRHFFKSDLGKLLKLAMFFRRKDKLQDRYLLKGFTQKEKKPKRRHRFDGAMIILIDEGSFSASCTYALMAKSAKRAVLIGEEAGGSYHIVSAGDSHDCNLKNSNLSVRIPIMFYEYNVDPSLQDKSKGVVPNIIKRFSITDYMNGVDTHLKTAVELIRLQGKE
jgi:Peptidase family S41